MWHPRLKYRSIAVEEHSHCGLDSFHFEWIGNDGRTQTPVRCGCLGDGCDSSLVDDDYGYDYIFEYDFDDSYYDSEALVGPDRLSVNSNNFTFYFQSDESTGKGHVVLDWECVKL